MLVCGLQCNANYMNGSTDSLCSSCLCSNSLAFSLSLHQCVLPFSPVLTATSYSSISFSWSLPAATYYSCIAGGNGVAPATGQDIINLIASRSVMIAGSTHGQVADSSSGLSSLALTIDSLQANTSYAIYCAAQDASAGRFLVYSSGLEVYMFTAQTLGKYIYIYIRM